MHAHHKKELLKLLSQFEDEDLLQLVWSANIVQSANHRDALPFLDLDSITPAAIGVTAPDPHAIHKWELETLVNEGLTTPKASPKRGRVRRFKNDHYGNIATCVNRLRKLENKEFHVGGHRKNIFAEMVRIANRQFPWQVGSANMANLYRNSFVYGQGQCAQTFEEKFGVSIGDFTKVAFGLFAHFMHKPVLIGDNGLEEVGISAEKFRLAIQPMCIKIDDAKRLARRERKGTIHIAYKPSILRQYPCLQMSDGPLRLRAPLPQLIIDRMTTGLFYDIISGGWAVREEYGRRFEEYCFNYSKVSLPEFNWEPEQKYKVKKQTFDTSDGLCFEKDKLILAIECKATRMSRVAMYGSDPTSDRGFKDLVKAVKQVWRFFAHCRLGSCPIDVDPNAVGMILTLDNWLVMAEKLRQEVIRRAADEIEAFSNGLVEEVDKRQIIFAPIQQYEKVLSAATNESFLELLSEATKESRRGWNLDSIHQELDNFDQNIDREFAFKSEVSAVLPWWESFDDPR